MKTVLYIVQDTKTGKFTIKFIWIDPETNQTAHFADITLDQNSRMLKEDEIVVDCKYKPKMIPQLIKLGILKSKLVSVF